jgi:hypothetical protein
MASNRFNQDYTNQSDDVDSAGIEHYLRSNLVADRLSSPGRQPGGIRNQFFGGLDESSMQINP